VAKRNSPPDSHRVATFVVVADRVLTATVAGVVAPSPEAPTQAEFVDVVRRYSTKLAGLLSEPPWAPWNPATWRSARSARTDPELAKVLQRLYGLTDELLRMYCVSPVDVGGEHWGLSKEEQQRVLDVLATDPAELRLESGLEVFDAFDRLLVEIGDARYICAEVQGELLMSDRATSHVTWRDLFGDDRPAALATYNSGAVPKPDELDAARSMLASLRRVRSDDDQTHRARQRMRARNLKVLSALLLPVVVAFGWLTVIAGEVSAAQVGLVVVAGVLGGIVAGTFKARDRLVRASDLRAFRAGMVAQVLIGGGSALLVLLMLESGVFSFGEVEAWAAEAMAGFVAGFSEPFVFRTVERVARLGVDV
jgi:hypothetical protein